MQNTDPNSELRQYKQVQSIAKAVLNEMSHYIKSGISEKDIATHCKNLMLSKGIKNFWYYSIPALVLVGERTLLSTSGKQYEPSELQVSERDLVTIDLSPELNGCWGDCARSFVITNGKVCTQEIPDKELSAGIEFEKSLHRKLMQFATPEKTFEALHSYFNSIIAENGYINLDFHKNLGHSIEKNINNRKFIEKGCKTRLNEVNYFTFEPHICKTDMKWGFKLENIYYFENNYLNEL